MDLSRLLGLKQKSQGQREMADTPVAVPRSRKRKAPRKSVQLGYLLILLEDGELSEGQIRFVVKLQGKMKLEELLSAQELYLKLRKSSRSNARSRKEREEVQRRTPSLDAKSTLAEKRRIGVGYRDKGALRPSHRPREVVRVFWSEDIPGYSSLNKDGEQEDPRWISAEELFEAKRYGPEFRTFGRKFIDTKLGNSNSNLFFFGQES